MFMPDTNQGVIIRTLLVNGFDLERAERNPGQLILDVHRYDVFGTRVSYSVAFFDAQPSQPAIEAFEKRAKYDSRIPLLVGPAGNYSLTNLTLENFLERLGGPVDHIFLTTTNLPDRLEDLGFNRTPSGLDEKPEDLLEESTKCCLQYLLMQRARRWGSERLFESLPDGIAFGKSGLVLLFDAKAYTSGYEVTADDVRRYADYVNTYHKKYLALLGRVHSMLVVSGKFLQEDATLRDRSAELYAQVSVPLSFIKARTLGELVRMLLKHPRLRPSIDWKKIFGQPIVAAKMLQDQMKALKKDGLIQNV
jgi:hypothetical protein